MEDEIKPLHPRHILQEDYQAADVVCNLGFLFDSELSFKHQELANGPLYRFNENISLTSSQTTNSL